MPFTRKTTRTYRPETFYRHFNDARALQTYTHDAHARKTHAKRTRNAHETSTMTGGATLRSLPVPNPHCSPTNRTDPWATLRPKPTSHCSPPPSPPQPALFADHLHPNPHSSPKFGLYRFFNIFSSKFLSFNMADLAQKWGFSIEIPIF